MPSWLVPAIVSATGVAIVVVVNLLLIGKWVGNITAAQTNLLALVGELKRRLDDFESEVESEAGHRAAFAVRMDNAEKAAEALWGVRDKLTALQAAGEVEGRHTREKLDSLSRDMGGIQRHLANMIAAGKAPVREFSADG